MKRNPSSILCASPLLLLAMLSGCSKQEKPLAIPEPKKVQQAMPAVEPALPVQKQLSTAVRPGHLDFGKRTDPFKSFVPAVAAPAARSARPRVRPSLDLLPIQSFEAGKFKVSGIIAGLKANRALLIDPNGKGYVVQAGMLIGSNEGRISRITASSVEVVETYKTENGRTKKRKIVLTLAKKR